MFSGNKVKRVIVTVGSQRKPSDSYSQLILELFDLLLQRLHLLVLLLLPLGGRSSGVGELRQTVQGVFELHHLP